MRTGGAAAAASGESYSAAAPLRRGVTGLDVPTPTPPPRSTAERSDCVVASAMRTFGRCSGCSTGTTAVSVFGLTRVPPRTRRK